MSRWLCLCAGSLLGGVSRYLLAGAVYQGLGTAFPYGTLAVNLLGCLLMGCFDSLAVQRSLFGPEMRLLLMTGFCGAFTTLSTLMFETSNLARDGQALRALSNVLLTVTLGFILFRLGSLLGRAI